MVVFENALLFSTFVKILSTCSVYIYIFRLKDLETSVRSQVAAEERAHKIVEKLVLEDEISEEFLLQSVSFKMCYFKLTLPLSE